MNLGVIIGRFQVAELTDGHIYLIDEVSKLHSSIVVLLGCARVQGTRHDPLDYITREKMLKEILPNALVLPVHDMLDDQDWSNQVDSIISGVCPKADNVIIYGGPDSFAPHYHGKHKVKEIEAAKIFERGTEKREMTGQDSQNSSLFRAGVIYSTQNSWPCVKACVDIACIRKVVPSGCGEMMPEEFALMEKGLPTELLLGRKPSENKWRLPGGMIDKGENAEDAAQRELEEETEILVPRESFTYLGSFPVDDWRYRKVKELGLVTSLFIARYQSGHAGAGDDLYEVKWVRVDEIKMDEIMDGHKPLIEKVKEWVNGR